MQKPNLTYREVTQAAEKFLKTNHPSSTLPIPIESIVEQKMNISLFVVPGIKKLLGIDAFINSDFNQITIDENSFVTFPERTRFSIAHEIGHLVLHRDWYEKYGPKNFEDYLNSHDRMDNEIYKYIEIQASTFAGLVLVPPKLLMSEMKKKLGKIPIKEEPEIFFPIAQDLLSSFQVSGEVLLRRLQREEIVKSSY